MVVGKIISIFDISIEVILNSDTVKIGDILTTGDNGVLKLIGTTETAVNNEIQLRNTIYNLTRLINLKDTAY